MCVRTWGSRCQESDDGIATILGSEHVTGISGYLSPITSCSGLRYTQFYTIALSVLPPSQISWTENLFIQMWPIIELSFKGLLSPLLYLQLFRKTRFIVLNVKAARVTWAGLILDQTYQMAGASPNMGRIIYGAALQQTSLTGRKRSVFMAVPKRQQL